MLQIAVKTLQNGSKMLQIAVKTLQNDRKRSKIHLQQKPACDSNTQRVLESQAGFARRACGKKTSLGNQAAPQGIDAGRAYRNTTELCAGAKRNECGSSAVKMNARVDCELEGAREEIQGPRQGAQCDVACERIHSASNVQQPKRRARKTGGCQTTKNKKQHHARAATSRRLRSSCDVLAGVGVVKKGGQKPGRPGGLRERRLPQE